jgi:hypothetical protein
MLTYSERLEQAESIDELLDLKGDICKAVEDTDDEIDILNCELALYQSLLKEVDNAIAQLEDSD